MEAAAGEGSRRPGEWSTLVVGQEVEVVKLSPQGDVVARYPATVVATDVAEGWFGVVAVWTYKPVDVAMLSFHPGDHLLEWFSPDHGFNAFAVFSPAGQLHGWYANVTHPARLQWSDGLPTLNWHDLYLDLVADANGH